MPRPQDYLRRIIRIRATDSPNVRIGLAEVAAGMPPSDRTIPGVLSYQEYEYRRRVWDPVRQTIGLDGEFYQGSILLLYPPHWIDDAELRGHKLPRHRPGKAMGIDPAEGGDSSSFCVGDQDGLIELVSEKTPNTSDVVAIASRLQQKYSVPWERVAFDRGGGGKQHADRLRERGCQVMTVAFGETVNPPLSAAKKIVPVRRRDMENRYEYRNMRAKMYWDLHEWLDPDLDFEGPRFSMPSSDRGEQYRELRRQMSVIPKMFDAEGRARLPAKNRQGQAGSGKSEKTIVELLGRSPDELDSLVLMRYAMTAKPKGRIGAI